MKRLLTPTILPPLTLLAGCLGLLLRIWLFSTGADESGLLVGGHPAEILIWLLCASTLAWLWLGCRPLVAAPKYSFNYPASAIGAAGCALFALAFGFTSVTELLGRPDTLGLLAAVLGVLAALALLILAVVRYRGDQPNFLLHALVCISFMVRLVSLYRQWSTDPQLQDYCFQLLATVCLMLSFYYRAAFDVDMGRRRPLAFFHLATVFFCLLSITHKDFVFFYLPAGIWAMADLCNLAPLPPQTQEDA